MKYNVCFVTLLSILSIFTGCIKDQNNLTAPTIVATEEWGFTMDNDSSNRGQTTLEKESDGTICGKGIWSFVHQGMNVQCPFKGGNVTVADTVISITAQGTATAPSAPVGFQNSPFTVNVNGSTSNGISSGTMSITFSTPGWPSQLAGKFTATRKSGSGVTK